MTDEQQRGQKLAAFQTRLGYSFKNIALLDEALTHSSFANEAGLRFFNERLEFLGDAVLELVSSEMLYAEHGEYDEGKLTRLRAKLVCMESLSLWSSSLGIPLLIRLGNSLRRCGATQSMSADAAEAVFGAIFLDAGYEAAKMVVLAFLSHAEQNISSESADPKTRLQELLQKDGGDVPYYHTVERKGPDHALRFRVVAELGGKKLAEAWGQSVKDAEFAAASAALKKMKK